MKTALTSDDTALMLAYDQHLPATPQDEIDRAVAALQAKKDTWARLPTAERLEYLSSIDRSFQKLDHDWVHLNLLAKDAAGDDYAEGLEWACGPVAITHYLHELQSSLSSIQERGFPKLPRKVWQNEHGHLVARIYPRNLYEWVTTSGMSAEVWMERSLGSASMPADAVRRTQALAYQEPEPDGKVVLVLGAGNVSAIPVNDTLSKLFVEKKVVVLKLNPANEFVGLLIEAGLSVLIEAGCLRVVYGGVGEGVYLTRHPGIDEIHLTGSDKTYDAIVFGSGEAGTERKIKREPQTRLPFTAELGNICPAIIVPGPWSQADIAYQAEQIASNLCDTGGYACSRARLVIQHAGWEQREPLLEAVRSVLAKVPPRAPYYPGGRELYQRFLAAHPESEQFGGRENGRLPWTLIPYLDPSNQADMCFTTESFCPVLTETALEAQSPAGFIDRAVEFANDHVWGSLTCAIIVHPQSLKDPQTRLALERAVASLRYGIVTLNSLPSLGWLLNSIPWGSYPGNQPWDIQSGSGFVHNAYMFSKPEKTVLRGPFRTWPRPIWFPSRARAIKAVARAMAAYEHKPSLRNLLSIVWGAVVK